MAATRPPVKRDRSVVVIENIETEADRQFKAIARKQISCDISIQQQLNEARSFEKSSVQDDNTLAVQGQQSLADFQCVQEQSQQREELRSYGLTEDEVQYKLTGDSEAPTAKKSKMLIRIEEKIANKMQALEKPTSFRSAVSLSRHELDLEKAIGRNRKQAEFMEHLVSNKEKVDNKYPPDHPMNHLDALLPETETKFIGPLPKPEGFVSAPMESEDGMIGPWVRVQKPQSILTVNKKKRTGTPFCALRFKGHAVSAVHRTNDTRVRILENEVKVISSDIISQGRLNLDEIKQLPRFADYDIGDPSDTLFVKNLAPSVDEEELASVFLNFEEDQKFLFRLMCGRMKGQAFIQVHDAIKAKTIIEAVNGFKLKGKPIIIQYSKKSGVG